MKRILVTGADGQLGLCLQKIAKEYTGLEFIFKDSKQLDITDRSKINFIFNNQEFDFCINCAAYTDVEQTEHTPEIAYEVNAEGVKNLSKICKSKKVVLVHISTDYVFDGLKDSPYTVFDVPNPINEYGKSKLKGEKYIEDLLMQYYIIRTSWLYSEFGKNFYNSILKKAKEQNILYVTNEQIGCPTSAYNLARFILKIICEEFDFGLYHFTDNEEMTWFDFATKIVEREGLSVKLVPKNYSSFVNRPKYSVLK
ncbi:dTDP-4-dehydrorhamnose reductase [uncultured Maribacter sp.]|uniref:dTDP-4-dehydrorhamnose reductase n=1 Tax=uncultured Maribacter sp. TaxID=431308 RepID=UPI0030DAF3CE|tara:strand:+ start:1548 stop:2309 length:762 start_codon:yes stop_codon:yes gene_type:complete